MNRRSTELLAKVMSANTAVGKLTVDACSRQDGGFLPADAVTGIRDLYREVVTALDGYLAADAYPAPVDEPAVRGTVIDAAPAGTS
jgi:hypothetical protein